jgi:hypothetical protein
MGLLYQLDLTRPPSFVEECLLRAVEAQEQKPPLAGPRLNSNCHPWHRRAWLGRNRWSWSHPRSPRQLVTGVEGSRPVGGNGLKKPPPPLPAPKISPQEARKNELAAELTSERSREIRTRRMQSEVILAKARNELIPKAVVQQQASYLLVAVRQKILSVPQTHARRILNLSDYGKAREVLKAIMTGLLCELQDLPDKVTDPNWLGAGVGSVVPSRGELP